MPRFSEDPVRHVITFRVNNDERKILKRLARQSGVSLSQFIRRQFQEINDLENYRRQAGH